MEAELKPKVLATFDTIAGTYKKLRRLQDKRSSSRSRARSWLKAAAKAYEKARDRSSSST